MPDPAELPAVPGALNVTELDGSEIVSIALRTPVSAQTTVQTIADFIGGGGGSGAEPLCATLLTRSRTVVTDPIVSTTARVIQNVYQTPAAATITVQTLDNHGFTTGDVVNVRVGGLQGTTKRANPSNGTWTITVTGLRTFVLDTSVWVADSLFYHGICYNGPLFNARPTLTQLMNYIIEDGGGTIILPAGICALLTKEFGNTGLSLPDGVTMIGQGWNTSSLFIGDGYNAFGMQSIGTSHISLSDFTLFGNRQYQGVGGFHAIRCGGLQNIISTDVTFRNLKVLGSAGYGMGLQSDGGFVDYNFENLIINECDSDGIDCKDRFFASKNYSVNGLRIYNFGLRNYGIDYLPVRLVNNPFATTTGLTTVVVTHASHAFLVGDPATFTGATTFNGVNMNAGTYLITARTTNNYTVDTGQVATGTGSGGGNVVNEYVTNYSGGDTALDCRGVRWNINDVHIESDMVGRAGVRLRVGAQGGAYQVNGSGPNWSNITNVTVLNTGPSQQSAIALYDGSEACNVSNITSKDCQYGLYVGSPAKRGNYTNVNVTNCQTGVFIDGEECNISNSKVFNATTAAYYVNGGDIIIGGEVIDNGFTTSIGSAVVTVTIPTASLVAGVTVITFNGATNINGVNPNNTNFTVLAVLDANTMTFTATTVATASGSGGGANAVWATGITVHNATNAIFNGNTASNSAVGYQMDTRARNATFTACKVVNNTLDFQNNGVGTIFRSDFFTANPTITMPLAGTTTPTVLTLAQSGSTLYLPSNATEKCLLVLPASTTQTIGAKYLLKSNSAQGFGISCSLGGIRYLSIALTSNQTLSSTDVGASLYIECDRTSGWQVSAALGTWTGP